MGTIQSCLSEEDQKELTKNDGLDLEGSNLDENLTALTTADVEVNIAIVGNSGSGRSSFINVILGFEEDYINAEKKVERTRPLSKLKTISYCHQEIPNIHFSVLPSLDQYTAVNYITGTHGNGNLNLSKFDAFLIFTDSKFTKKHVTVAKEVQSSNKPFFFIRTKFDLEKEGTAFDQEAVTTTVRESLDQHKELLDCREYEIYHISNLHPYQWVFTKLTKAIVDVLPFPQNESFNRIPKIQELLALEKFHDFMQEIEKQEKNATKFFPRQDEIKQLFVESGVLGVQRMMSEKLDLWKSVKINLAILGNSGTGKSSFINAIRGVDDGDDKLAAKTGVIETTIVPTSFNHPTNENIRFWDLPGIGTPNYPNLAVFCEKVAIEKYDTFLIICSKRFTQNDIELAKKVKSMGKSFFFVRTKIDNDLDSEKHKKEFDEAKTLTKIRDDCAENLKNFDEENIFLVSNYDPNKWDFDRLKKAIVDQLPSKQKESLTLSMRAYSEEMVNEKIQVLKDRVYMVAAASVVRRFTRKHFSLSVYGKLIRKKVKFYSKRLEFPENNSKEFKQLSPDLQERVKKFRPGDGGKDYLEWLKSFDPDNTYNIRMVGKMIITNKPFLFVYRLLNVILGEMKEAALAILCEAATRDSADSNNMATFELSAEDSDSDFDKISTDDVEINIAILGKAGSGRSSFVNTLGLKNAGTKDGRAESASKKTMSYFPPSEDLNVNFSILPNMDVTTFRDFSFFLKQVEFDKFDAFLIFTTHKLNRRHLILAKKIKSLNKPLFLIRTKIDNDENAEKRKENDEEAMLRELRASFAENLKEFRCDESDVYLMSNHHPDKWDFLKLITAITDVLPSPAQKACFSKIPKIQNLIALEIVQKSLRENETRMSQVEVSEVSQVFKKSGIVGVQRMMNEKLGEWKKIVVKLAILGNSGVGKSSFINALRGRNDDDDGAAPVGITETTLVPDPYKYPTNDNICFWDLPGIGTPNYPNLPVFCEKVAIEKYDTFLIVCANRFTENDVKLAKKVKSMEKSFFFVRSKIDSDKRSESRKREFDEEKMLKKIRDHCLNSLQHLDLTEDKVFLVSSHEPTKWDFEKLKEAILNELPLKQKECFTLSLRNDSKYIVKEKIKFLKAKVLMEATASVSKKIGIWPFFLFVDEERVKVTVQSYIAELDFPPHDSKEFEMLTNDLQKQVRKFDGLPSLTILQLLKSYDPDNNWKLSRKNNHLLATNPVEGIANFLNKILNEMEQTALAIFDEMLQSKSRDSDSD